MHEKRLEEHVYLVRYLLNLARTHQKECTITMNREVELLNRGKISKFSALIIPSNVWYYLEILMVCGSWVIY